MIERDKNPREVWSSDLKRSQEYTTGLALNVHCMRDLGNSLIRDIMDLYHRH